MPYRPRIHKPVRADRPGIAPRASQAGKFYNSADWKSLRAQVLARDQRRCRLGFEGCYGSATTAHHVLARADGGTDTLGNLVAACWGCHNKAHPEKGGNHG